MAPSTRTNSTTTEEILPSVREPIAQLMREEMEKLGDEMRTNAIEVSTSQLGRNQRDQRQNMQFNRVTKIEFPMFRGDDVKGWMYKCEQFFKFMRLLGSDTVPWLVYRGAIMVDIRDDQTISFYMAGLPNDIELAVRMFKPQTLSVAYSLSKLQVKTN
nr:hypothetical protein [Tanacetum cinerariifolium]